MDEVQISNILNLITQAHPFFNHYHFGWWSDIDINVANNFDPDGRDGKKYPAVQWLAPPEGTTDLVRLRTGLNMQLHFYDLQYYQNDGSADARTNIENWRDLRLASMQFLKRFMDTGKELAKGGLGFQIRGNEVNFQGDSNAHNDRLISMYYTFTLDMVISCPELVLDLTVFEGMPYPEVLTTDYETYKPEV